MKYMIYGALAIAVVAGFGVVSGKKSDTPQAEAVSTVRLTATISGRQYQPSSFDVPLGSTVELTVTNNDNEQHGLSVPDYGVQGFVGAGKTETVSFVASRLGQTTTFCSASHPEKLIINVI